MSKWTIKRRVFSLIEALIALSVFSMTLLLLLSATNQLFTLQRKLVLNTQLEEHLFIIQLSEETRGYEWGETEEMRLRSQLSDDWLQVECGAYKAGNVIYLCKNGGYHPILIGYEHCQLEKNGRIKLKMPDREVRPFQLVPRSLKRRVELIQEEGKEDAHRSYETI